MLSNTIKQKRKEKAGKWEVPLPKVRPIAEDEMFKVMKSGKRMKKSWKRMVTKVRVDDYLHIIMDSPFLFRVPLLCF